MEQNKEIDYVILEDENNPGKTMKMEKLFEFNLDTFN